MHSARNFSLLRTGQFIADLGGNASGLALPATVILAMHATTMQIGALDAVSSGAIPVCSAVAGVLADRLPRRPVLIGANLVRIAALATIPLAFALGQPPPLALFFIVAAIVGAASALFDTAYAAFLPLVVGEHEIARGTSKLAIGSAVAEATGTGIAGALVMAIGAPLVILVNVGTFVCSTFALSKIRVVERARLQLAAPGSLRRDLADGFAVVLAHPMLRRLTLSNAVAHLGGGMAAAVTTAYVYRELHLAPVQLGIVLGCANVGALAAWYAVRLSDRFGMRRTLAGAHLVSAAGKAIVPLFAGMFPLVALATSRVLLTAAGPIFAVNDSSLRVSVVSDALRCRATATARTIVWTALPLGSLLGGFLGDHIGLAATMLCGACVTAAAAPVAAAAARQAG